MAEVKTEVIRLRVTTEQKKLIQEAAADQNRTVSNFLLNLILDKIKK